MLFCLYESHFTHRIEVIPIKAFLETFLICIVLCVLAAVFLLPLLTKSFWAALLAAALLLAVLITAFLHQESKIEALEEKLTQLQKEDRSSPEED